MYARVLAEQMERSSVSVPEFLALIWHLKLLDFAGERQVA